MVLGLFRKKKVLDLRNHDDVFLRNRSSIIAKDAVASTASNSASSSNSSSQNSSPGFFGGFFGSSDSSSSTPAIENSSNSSATVDFWGNPIGSSSGNSTSNPSSMSGVINTDTPSYSGLNSASSNISNTDLLYKLSRITDRLELVEKKLARLDRKVGISGESSY